MTHFLTIILSVFWTVCYGQTINIVGTFTNGKVMPRFHVAFNADSTFEYKSTEHPTFYRWEGFFEKGRWTLSGDTVILNPQLATKPFVQSDIQEQGIKGDTTLQLTFNHIKRYFDENGNFIKADTIQMDQLDYAFNEFRKKNRTRVVQRPTTRCAFAGYIPKEVITTSRTITVSRPSENLKSIFIGSYELRGTKEFLLKNPDINHLILNVYSNYYQDGQIRQMKFLAKNNNFLYILQKPNGKFIKDNAWMGTDISIKRQKDSR